MIAGGLVNVFTDDIARAMAFYQGVLGLTESFRTPADGIPDHVEMMADGFTIALSTAEAPRRAHGLEVDVGRPAMTLGFWVDDVDAVFNDVAAAGALVVTPPHDAGNDNRNAVIRDPDGTLVELVAKRS